MNDPATRDDETTARAVQQGDQEALVLLIARYHGPLLGLLYRLLGGDRAGAEDLVQETFMRLIQRIHDYDPTRPFRPWLFAIAANLARDHHKRADTRRVSSAQPVLWAARPAPEPGPAEQVQDRDDQRQALAALGHLPPSQREVILLRYGEALSLAEIASILDVPVGTVKSRLSIGLRRLRERLEAAP